jgi:hypothetical protein
MRTTLAPPDAPPRPQLPIDPRIRQRRVDVQRAIGRRRIRIAAVIGCIAGLVALSIVSLHLPLAAVRHQRVVGIHHESEAAVLAAARIRHGEPLIDVRPSAAATGIDGLPWVASASVRRAWFSGIDITVVERKAVAQVPVGLSVTGPVDEVDATGRVLKRRASPAPNLPMVLGAGAPGPLGSWLASSPGPSAGGAPAVAISDGLNHPTSTVAAALAFASSITSAGIGRPSPVKGDQDAWVSVVEVGADGTLTAVAEPSKATLLLGPDTQLSAKLVAVVAMLRQVPLSAGTIVDFADPDRPTTQ